MRRIGLAHLLVAVGIAAVATGCAASGVETGEDSGTDAQPAPDGLEELIEEYLGSWEAKDEAALRASVTDDFIVDEYIYTAVTGKPYGTIHDDADGVVSDGFGYDWQNEIVDDMAVTGRGPWTVSHRERWYHQASAYDGIATYTVVDDGGTLRIARHTWAGFVVHEF